MMAFGPKRKNLKVNPLAPPDILDSVDLCADLNLLYSILSLIRSGDTDC